MAKEIKHVLVAGPNGTLGPPIISALQSAHFAITLLTTNIDKTQASFPKILALQTDYTSTETLLSTLHSVPAPPQETGLVILLNRDQATPQITLLNAAAAWGIAHVLPSSFGVGQPTNPYLRAFPPLQGKYEMEDHVTSLGSQGKLSYTCIQTGVFLDWALGLDILVNLSGAASPFGGAGTTTRFDGGDQKFSATTLEDIGEAVVGVLRDPTAWENRHVHVHSAVLSQNQLLEYARALAPGREFPVVEVDTEGLERAAWGKFRAGDTSRETMRLFMPRPTFGLGMGLFGEVANEGFGFRVYEEEDVKALVGRYLKP